MPSVIRTTVELSPVQGQALSCQARYLDCEGAIRSGKSFIGCHKTLQWVSKPGAHVLLSRWSEGDLDAQLKPMWRDIAKAMGLVLRWNPHEQYDEVVQTGSRVYLRGLKASEATSRYAKFRGLTLSNIWVDQPEEIPYDVFLELQGRLSQPGYPHQLLLTPNPPSEGHWIAKEFPEDLSQQKPDHAYLRFRLRDNEIHLGAQTCTAIEAAYPEGTAQRRRLIDGRRGLAAHGDPVYRGYFARGLHVQPVEMDPQVPLLEAWDYGHSHPAVLWGQMLPWGELRLLGAVMGQDMFLPDFAPLALKYRSEWMPNALTVQSTGDPAGEQASNQGAPKRAVDMLREFGVFPQPCLGANHPDRRDAAIQATAGYMRRRTTRGEAFTVNPRCMLVSAERQIQTEVVVDGLEAGYVWDDRQLSGRLSPSTRVPRKDGWYDHLQNCLEYLQLAFGIVQGTTKAAAKTEQQMIKRSQHDVDEWDRRPATARRGGY